MIRVNFIVPSDTPRRGPTFAIGSTLRCIAFSTAALLLSPLVPQALECNGGNQGGGGLVLKTIACDGNPTDWTEILANASQVTVDGDGSSMDCSISTDLDCPIGQTGRDMNRFTWTYDAANIYLFQSRYGSMNNTQTFFFYMDVGVDKFMGPTDYILKVEYQGSNRRTKVQLFRFVPQDGSTPDPMECPAGPGCVPGFADGYNMPGFYAIINDPACQVCTLTEYDGGFNVGGAGSPLDGEGFEVYVPWADLNLPAPQGVYFHVAATGSSGIILDNCGNPDGKVGFFGFHAVDVEAPQEASVPTSAAPTTVSFSHTVKNTGLFANDTMNLKAVSSLGLRVDLWDESGPTLMGTDANGDGDFSDPGDYVNGAYDSDADGYPDTGPMPRYDAANPATVFNLRLDVAVPASPLPLADETILLASISGQDVSDCLTDTTRLGDVEMLPNLSLYGTPGSLVNFAHTVRHFVTADRVNLSAVSALGWGFTLFSDPEGDGDPAGNDVMGIDADGDGTFSGPGDFLDPLYDTDGDGYPDTGLLAPGVPFPFILQAAALGPVGTVNSYDLTGIMTGANGYVQCHVQDSLEVMTRISISPDNQIYGAAGYSLFLPHVVRNSYGAADAALLSHSVTQNGTPVSWTVRYWSDPDCDGSIADGSLLAVVPPETRQETGTLAANGGSSCIVAELQVPSGALDGAAVVLSITATSKNDGAVPPASDGATDLVALSMLAACRDSAGTQTETLFTTCDTIFAHGFNWGPGDIYFVHFLDAGGADVSGPLQVAVNGLGEFSAGYSVRPGDLPGAWSVRLYDDRDLTLVREILVTVSALAPVISGPPSICARGSAVLEAEAGWASYLWAPGGETSRTILASPASTTSFTCVFTDVNGCQATAAHMLTVSGCPNLLRNAEVTQLSPQSPPNSSIFQVGIPALTPGQDDEVLGFESGALFPSDTADLGSSASPLIFYELENVAGDTLRVAITGGKVVITY